MHEVLSGGGGFFVFSDSIEFIPHHCDLNHLQQFWEKGKVEKDTLCEENDHTESVRLDA